MIFLFFYLRREDGGASLALITHYHKKINLRGVIFADFYIFARRGTPAFCVFLQIHGLIIVTDVKIYKNQTCFSTVLHNLSENA